MGPEQHSRASKLPQHFGELLHKLLFCAHQSFSRSDFLRQACEVLMQFSGCDILEVRIAENGWTQKCRSWLKDGGTICCDVGAASSAEGVPGPAGSSPRTAPILEAVLNGDLTVAAPFLTRSGSFWTGDAARPVVLRDKGGKAPGSRTIVIGGDFPSLALIPFPVDSHTKGVLQLGSRRREHFTGNDVQLYEAVAETLGVALAHQRAQWALRERVKELTCLYEVTRATQDQDRPVHELLQETVELLPPAWQYPEITSACITLDGRTFATAGFCASPWKQSADVVIDGVLRGRIDVIYSAAKPEIDEGPFLKEERNLINGLAEALGISLSYRHSQWQLRERVKELTCLHALGAIAQQPELSLVQLLQEVVNILPPAFQYPDITGARLILDGESFATSGFVEDGSRLAADIASGERFRGSIEVVYTASRPQADEGPFLKEERDLMQEVARRVGLILERRDAEEEKIKLQGQLRHADRLATIGQLAAGAAHELNEPLGSVLGFAQLAKNCPQIPVQAEQDIEKVINAALHAREVIKKLMIFSRQMPTRMAPCNLNGLIRDGLLFLESRCAREGISLVRRLEEKLPEITADPSQLHQVLVNLVVNAIQAMPHGGTLTIETRSQGDRIILTVGDTGLGMTDEVLKQLFIPFFTTKDIGHGTGLGLSVVHGIVSSHGGTIRVESKPGTGSRFVVTLPAGKASTSMENT